jgi:hypothetical protein
MNIKDLTIEEINLILVALGKLPLETTLALFSKIKSQAETQLQEKKERTTDELSVAKGKN